MPTSEELQNLEPRNRVRHLANLERDELFDSRVPIHRYFRSGTEMLRMAKMYRAEGQLENAFILYSRYITLFVEKIPKHPNYNAVTANEKFATKKQLMLVFPVAEEIKTQLLDYFSVEYNKKLEEKKIQDEKDILQQQMKSDVISDGKSINESDGKSWILPLNEDFDKSLNFSVSSRGRDSAQSTDSIQYPDLDELPSPVPSLSSADSTSTSRSVIGRKTPSVDRSTKPRSLLSPGPETEQVHGLRVVIVPVDIIPSFLRLAQSNTDLNIETCGILTGKMVHNQLVVTHLIVPKQSGTSDSCSTDNEEDIFVYQDKYDLLTIGWIHTHPSQTAFMSSVDLHTHCSYQLVMPEAIAIVCSPKYKETGIFSLTPDYGLDYVAGCRQTGFHLHPKEPPLYEESPHVKLDEHATFVVADLRT